MSNLKDATKHTGYSQEEKYFHEYNQQLLEKMKQRGWSVIQGGANGSQTEQKQTPTPHDSKPKTKKAA